MTMKTFLVAVALGTGLIVSGMVTHADQTSKSLNAVVQASDQSPVPLSNDDEPPQTSQVDLSMSSGSSALEKNSEDHKDRVNTSNHTTSNQPVSSVQAPSSPLYSQHAPAISPATYYPVVKDPIYLLYDKALNQLFKEGQLNSLTIVLVIIIGYMIRYKQQPQMTDTSPQQTADHTASFLKRYIQHFLMILTIICLLVALFIAKQILVLLI